MVKTMTSKERAYLRGLANRVPSLYQVGKDGVSENMIKQKDDALEARELIKGNEQEKSMMSAREVAEELASQTASQVVQVIGNRFVLYRRSKKNLCEM